MQTEEKSFRIVGNKAILRVKARVCETSDELLSSGPFLETAKICIAELTAKESTFSVLFPERNVAEAAVRLACAFRMLCKLPISQAAAAYAEGESLFRDPQLLSAFVEHFYNFWRSFDRFVICDSEGDRLDRRPYRTFNETIGRLTHLIRAVYRDIQESIVGGHPRIYRQVAAGAEIAAISLPRPLPLPERYSQLADIPVIRQVLINPPLILNPPMNKRTGQFARIDRNPIDLVSLNPLEWLCYPAMAGPLVVWVYFHESFYELGFSLCNLFELADDQALLKTPDAVYFYGVSEDALTSFGTFPTVFHEDAESGILVGAVPAGQQFGYFGYLKKMILTLHNVRMMRLGRLPFHGAFVRIDLKGGAGKNVLIIGDTGAGKSEMLEALRSIGTESIRDITTVADDMGSIDITEEGHIVGYGTETGAFLRLDDLRPGYAFGQIDRSIIMSPSQVNARIILPVTTHETITKGFPVDMILYANNYEQIDEEHPTLERFESVERALRVFRAGTVMSKGTTTSSGIVHSYFANIFGPAQYRDLHDGLAATFFNAFFSKKLYVGQIRTRLGIAGFEMEGPEAAARELLRAIKGEG